MRVARTRGVVLIALAVVLTLAALYGLVQALAAASRAAPLARKADERTTLIRARQALIAFALVNRNRPGGLPCPDRNGDGEAELACDRPTDRLGWLPWQTLATGDLRDASGERLLYALASNYRNDPDAIINPATEGDLAVPARGWDDLAAVVIAPGPALAGQTRDDTRIPGAFIEVTFDGRGLEFTPRSNDTAEPLAAGELWQAIDPIVGLRIEREVAPYFETEYIARWNALPFATAFAPDSGAPIPPSASFDLEGGLPATREPAWVGWDLASVQVTQSGGSGRLDAARCERSIASEIRCELAYTAPIRIRIIALAQHVAFALVAPTGATPAEFGPATLDTPSVRFDPIDPAGSARAIAEAGLPATGTLTSVTLRAPAYIGPLTDPRTPVAHALSWFARNRYARFVYYARAGGCPAQCLRIRDASGNVLAAPAALVYAGRGRADSARSPVERFLEGDNSSAHDGSYERHPARAGANDLAIALCVAPAYRCGTVR